MRTPSTVLISLLIGVGSFVATAAAAEPAIVLLPASHELDASSLDGKNLDGHWIAVCDDRNGSSTLTPIDLHYSAPACPGNGNTCDHDDKVMTLTWTSSCEATFLVSGLPVTEVKKIPSTQFMSPCLLNTTLEQCALSVDKDTFTLTAAGLAAPTSAAAPQEFSIVYAYGGQTQKLWDLRRDSTEAWDDPHFSLEWAGDLDGDGHPDLLMILTEKYTALPQILFLSSKAPKGQLLGRAAEYLSED